MSELVPCFIHELKELGKGKAERCCENVTRSCGMSQAVPLQPEHQEVEQSIYTSSPMQCLHTVTMQAVGRSFTSLGDVRISFRGTVTDGHSASRQLFIRHTQALMFTV